MRATCADVRDVLTCGLCWRAGCAGVRAVLCWRAGCAGVRAVLCWRAGCAGERAVLCVRPVLTCGMC